MTKPHDDTTKNPESNKLPTGNPLLQDFSEVSSMVRRRSLLSKSNNTFLTNAFKMSEKDYVLDFPKVNIQKPIEDSSDESDANSIIQSKLKGNELFKAGKRGSQDRKQSLLKVTAKGQKFEQTSVLTEKRTQEELDQITQSKQNNIDKRHTQVATVRQPKRRKTISMDFAEPGKMNPFMVNFDIFTSKFFGK